MTTISVVVPAAGCGARTKLDGNKVLFPLHGRPLLWWTLRALSAPDAMPPDCQLLEIIVAARREEFPLIEDVFESLQTAQSTLSALLSIGLRLVEGGDSRQSSVANAVRVAGGDLVAVHDAARPLVSAHLMARTIQAARHSGAAIAALPVWDTVKLAGESSEGGPPTIAVTLDRRLVWLAQTPQIFGRKVLLDAFERAQRDGIIGTDCSSLVETIHPVTLVPGDADNFKVTYAPDIERAAQLIGERWMNADDSVK